jgi:hypothetical protein
MAARSKGEVTGPWNGLGRPAWADRPWPIPAQLPASFTLRRFPNLLGPSPFCMWALVVSFSSSWTIAPCPTRFGTFLGRSSEFIIFLGLVPGLLGVKFASLHDLYGASRSCHKVHDELIPEVLLSTSKPCINTKLQNRHARMNLLYQGG